MNMRKLQVSIVFLVSFISVSCCKTEKIRSLTAKEYASMHRSHVQNPVVGQTDRLPLQRLFRQRRTSNSNGKCESLSSYNKRVICDLHYLIVDLSNHTKLSDRKDTSESFHFNVSRCVGRCQTDTSLFCVPEHVREECVLVPMENNNNSKITLYHHTKCGRKGTKCSSTTNRIDKLPPYEITENVS